MHIRSLLNKSIDDMRKEITGPAIYSNERICIENWFEGHLTNSEYFSIIRSSDVNTISNKHDKIPELIFWLKTFKKCIILPFRNRKRNNKTIQY